MYLRKLWLIIAVLGAMASPLSLGLGLGEITLNSNLNEPLDADIKLLQVRDLAEEEIFVDLGTAEDFRRRGIERLFFLQDFRFEVQLDNAVGPVIKVTSQKPVIEPFLIFIIQIETQSSGRAQREYTLLMDLPVFTDRPTLPVQGAETRPQVQPQPTAPPVQPAQPQTPPSRPPQSTASTPPPPLPTRPDTPEPQTRPQPQPQPTVRTTPPEPLSPSLQSGETYGVRANDTLWEIALSTRPNRGVSVQQTMLALQRLNPDAFIDGNINLLKEGQVLRIPDMSEIQQLDQRAAVNEVAYQNTQRYGNPDGLVSGAELQGSPTQTVDDDDDDTRRGQLTLASPSEPTNATGDRSGSGLSTGERDALENDLAITLEQLDSSNRENAELSERVQELEEQISTMDRLIDISNEEMRTLQLALEQNARNADAVIELPDVPGTETVVEDAADDSVATTDAPAATPTPQPVPVSPPVIPVQPQPTIVDMLMDYIWYIGIAVIVILLAAFYMWHRKTQADMANFDDFDDEDFDDQGGMEFGNDDFQDVIETEDDFDLGMDDEPIEEEEIEEQAAPTEAETGDAVGEADIYIAYGKYDQAEEMLQRAIIAEPGNVEARLKLLEVYSETTDVTKFDGEYGKLLALGDASASARAAELRTSIPGAGQYQSAADTTIDRQFDNIHNNETIREEIEPAEDSLDLNLDFGDDVLEETAETSEENDGIDFAFDEGAGFTDLDLDDNNLETPAAVDTSSATASTKDDDFGSLDFNLDLDDDSELALDTEEDQALTLDLDNDEEAIDENLTLQIEGDDEELALDLEEDDDLSFDLDTDEAEFDKEFESVLDEEPLADTSVNETVSRDFDFEPAADSAAGGDDILSDLEFSAAALATEEDKNEALEENASLHGADAAATSDGDDDFDLALGDVDLAALDEEMDALVGDLDDVDDDDVAVSPTEVVPALTEEEINEAGFDFETDIDLDSDLGVDTSTAVEQPAVADNETDLDEDSELDFLADTDEVATKLDLARAYIDMGDKEGAKDILSEVVNEGNDEQKTEAQALLGKV